LSADAFYTSTLCPLAQNLISARASQAFVQHIFSVCGVLTAGRRNRMIFDIRALWR